MKRWSAALLWVPFAAAPAHSAPDFGQPLTIPAPDGEPRRGLDLRIIEDPAFAPSPTHNSGMIAQTPVSSNASIGFGLLKVAPRRAGSGEYRPESEPRSSRKAAVRFELKF